MRGLFLDDLLVTAGPKVLEKTAHVLSAEFHQNLAHAFCITRAEGRKCVGLSAKGVCEYHAHNGEVSPCAESQ